MSLKTKRNEVIKLMFCVILLGVILSSIANIIFEEFYYYKKIVYIIITLSAFVICTVMIIKILLKNESIKTHAQILSAYDIVNQKFVDIPNSLSSVNARILYHSLSNKMQNKLEFKTVFDVHKCEMFDFCNSFIIQLIFSRFLKNTVYKNKVDINFLKEILVKFRYIDIDSILDSNIDEKSRLQPVPLALPKGFKIKEVNDNSIKLKSSYGFLYFSWDLIHYTMNGNYIKFLTAFDNVDSSNCLEILYKLNIEYGFKGITLFSKSTNEFNNFINDCLKKLKSFDINTSVQQYNLLKLPFLLNYIDNKHINTKSTEQFNWIITEMNKTNNK